jgi:hypothetical protein
MQNFLKFVLLFSIFTFSANAQENNNFCGTEISSVQWDAADYPCGIYYYLLKTDKISISRKMVLIK